MIGPQSTSLHMDHKLGIQRLEQTLVEAVYIVVHDQENDFSDIESKYKFLHLFVSSMVKYNDIVSKYNLLLSRILIDVFHTHCYLLTNLSLSYREVTSIIKRTRVWAALGTLFRVISSAYSSATASYLKEFLGRPFFLFHWGF